MSNAELPLVSSTGDRPIFDVTSISLELAALLPIPPGWSAREAGSTSGCACDFHGDGPEGRQYLAQYLRGLVPHQQVALLSTWYGDEQEPWLHQPALSVDNLLAHNSPIPQQTITPIT